MGVEVLVSIGGGGGPVVTGSVERLSVNLGNGESVVILAFDAASAFALASRSAFAFSSFSRKDNS